jgi:hypothetical protein
MPTALGLRWPLLAGLACVCAVGCSNSSAGGSSKDSRSVTKTVTVTTPTQSGGPASAGTITTPTSPHRLACGIDGYSCDDFKTPSGNIKCLATGDPHGTAGIACEMASGLNPKPPSNGCPSGGDLSVPNRGAAGFECRYDVSEAQLDKQIPALPYGAVWHGFGMFCISQMSGLTCINGDGHGFFASREQWRMF